MWTNTGKKDSGQKSKTNSKCRIYHLKYNEYVDVAVSYGSISFDVTYLIVSLLHRPTSTRMHFREYDLTGRWTSLFGNEAQRGKSEKTKEQLQASTFEQLRALTIF